MKKPSKKKTFIIKARATASTEQELNWKSNILLDEFLYQSELDLTQTHEATNMIACNNKVRYHPDTHYSSKFLRKSVL